MDIILFYLIYIGTNNILFQRIGYNLVLSSVTNLFVSYFINAVANVVVAYTMGEILASHPSAGT